MDEKNEVTEEEEEPADALQTREVWSNKACVVRGGGVFHSAPSVQQLGPGTDKDGSSVGHILLRRPAGPGLPFPSHEPLHSRVAFVR